MLLVVLAALPAAATIAMPGPVLPIRIDAAADTVDVADAAALQRFLKDPGRLGGKILLLAPGNYGALAESGLSSLTLRSADPRNPAVFSEVSLRDARDVTFENITVKYDFADGDKAHTVAFSIAGGERIILRGMTLTGDLARSVDPSDDGYPTGFGLRVRGAKGVTVEDSRISMFFRAALFGDSDDVVFRRNDVHDIRMDGLNFAAIQGVEIADNWIHDFRRSLTSKDHADMIQFWTNKTKRPSTDIVIRGNVLDSGVGKYTQSIFMRNEEVDTGRAGHEMYYRNIVIEQNVIINAHLHGISLGETDGLTIRKNTLIHNPVSDGEKPKPKLWRPRINIPDAAVNVVLRDNAAAGFPDARPGWDVGNNLAIQDMTRVDGNFYSLLFSDPFHRAADGVSGYTYLPDGPLQQRGIGADRLREPS
ncbi:right-handed parallel beta-helix repeat-containing protein [Frigidibacter sp. MR17.24]|uniref:right-handed parallel beta-helix repeat-containing protein n=1 Tax=Frigidibacter sp. MR17.24 TaxID=3127345 RepID=UPI0030131220